MFVFLTTGDWILDARCLMGRGAIITQFWNNLKIKHLVVDKLDV